MQITAVRLLRRLAADEVAWAQEAADGLWLPDEVQLRLDCGAGS